MGGENAEKVQDALYRIAELASAAQDMQEFYRAIHEIVGELMDAKNFFIALYDEERQLINWPYYVDESRHRGPDPNQWFEFGEGSGRGATAYVLRTGEPQLHLTPSGWRSSSEQGEIELLGRPASEDWLGVPLNAGRADGRRARRRSRTRRASATPSRTRSCSRSSASTSAPRSRAPARSRRRGSGTPSWR